MTVNTRDLVSSSWDQEYLSGKYNNEKPIEFTKDIFKTISKYLDPFVANGLYVGCGNGRNFIPLVDKGLNITGLDISKVAINKIITKSPQLEDRLICSDFRDFKSSTQFDFIIAIQVLQHGLIKDILSNFNKIEKLLKPNGLFFLCINANTTEIYHNHQIIEGTKSDGFTVEYLDGPKKNLHIHFFSKKELENCFKDWEFITNPIQKTTLRIEPKTGTWDQWELIIRKRDKNS